MGLASPGGFGLYVHWPYCTRLCPYCDFNIYRDRQGGHDDLLAAILADIKGHKERLDVPGPLHSLSFGGGTPSLLRPAQIAAVIETADQVFGFVPEAEISLEANPDRLDMDRCAGFAGAGINRLSIGVQSLDDQELKFLGRDHDAEEARRALEAAAKTGMRVSADFIYDLPDQSVSSWSKGLDDALALGLQHYSFYALTIEPGTAFGLQVKKGRLRPAPEERSADLYILTQERTAKAGLPAYEVSNHASKPEEQARHNLIYWQSGDWIGVGPGAHGRASLKGQRHALEAALRPEAYTRAVQETGWGVVEATALDTQDIIMETLSMGLRLREGLDIMALQTKTGFTLPAEKLHELIEEGYLAKDGATIRVRTKGWALIDRLVLELLT
ncbi:MAG: coproporphyrinogen III oxidase [Robiginitomaculum sp.]|nr:MAG: coproporphyrinogen III oxidase [Robiginitomaculum sp.]